MALHSIDYLNARKASKPASGGRSYAVTRNAVDTRAQYAEMHTLDRALCEADSIFAEFRSWVRNLPMPGTEFATEAEIPF